MIILSWWWFQVPIGFYATGGASSATLCPAGLVTSEAGATSIDNCTVCDGVCVCARACVRACARARARVFV
jgi:hypothetical protein